MKKAPVGAAKTPPAPKWGGRLFPYRFPYILS